MQIRDFPKLESPFVRKMNEKEEYLVTPEVTSGYEWVFNDPSVMAIEKIHGTNVSIVIENGVVTSIWNRTNPVPFFNKTQMHLVKGVIESYDRGYMENFADGQHFGELIGEKVNGNPYNIKGHLWLPFETYCKDHLQYKSWSSGKYKKDFETISTWFKELMPLYSYRINGRDNKEFKHFVEGVIFTHPDGRKAKLRKDMFEWYEGRRHGD